MLDLQNAHHQEWRCWQEFLTQDLAATVILWTRIPQSNISCGQHQQKEHNTSLLLLIEVNIHILGLLIFYFYQILLHQRKHFLSFRTIAIHQLCYPKSFLSFSSYILPSYKFGVPFLFYKELSTLGRIIFIHLLRSTVAISLSQSDYLPRDCPF